MLVALGLNGNAKSGKDTVADYLIEHHKWDGKFSYARNLKDMCKHIFRLSEFQVAEQEGKKEPFAEPITFNHTHLGAVLTWMCRTHSKISFSSEEEKRTTYAKLTSNLGRPLSTPREILQLVGTDICRTVYPNYHIEVLLNSLPDKGNIVVTDVRYENEAGAVRDLGGKILRLIRPDLNLSSDMYKHSSECALNDWDGFTAIISNDQDLSSLYEKVNNFLEENNLCRTTQ